MFDAITEDNFIGRGESDYDDGEDNNQTHNIKRFRQQIEHLNCDLHDLIYSGEEDEDGDEMEPFGEIGSGMGDGTDGNRMGPDRGTADSG